MSRPIELLLVEDNPADAELTADTLQDCRILHRLNVVGDGVEALRFVRQEGEFRDAPRPDLILLDLNLPRMNGHEVLAHLKEHADLKRIPVVVLTSSRSEKDIIASYDLHAAAYVQKPLDLDGFARIVRAIEGFWLSVVCFPP